MKSKTKLKKVVSFLITFVMFFSFIQLGNFEIAKAVTSGNENTQVKGLIFRMGNSTEADAIKPVDKAVDGDDESYIIRQLTMKESYILDSEDGYTLEDAKVDTKNMTVVKSMSGSKNKFSIVNIKDYSNFVLTVKIKKDGEDQSKTYNINVQFDTDSSLEFAKIVVNFDGQFSNEINYTDAYEDGVYKMGPVDSTINNATIEMYDKDGKQINFKVNNSTNKVVQLIGGDNEIYLTVTTGNMSKIYKLIINKKGVAELKSLVPSVGTLSPAFNSGTTDYTLTVPTETSSIAFTPTAVDNSSKIKVKNSVVESGKKSQNVKLDEGDNTINITVTTDDGDSTVYTVVVTRTPQFRSSQLTSLRLTTGTLSPTFNKGVYEYSATVENNVTSIGVTAVAEDANAKIKINGKEVPSGATSPYISIDEGGNIITVKVTDSKGNSSTYTISVTRRYSKNNVKLSSLSVTDGKMSPTFDPETYAYSVKVARNIESVRILFKSQNDKAKVKVNGVEYTNGQSDKIKLDLGSNLVTVEITGEDGSSTTKYMLSIIRDKIEGTNQWVIINGNWTFYNGYGTQVKNDWVKYDNLWYFMDVNGYMQKGWQNIGGSYYYFNNDGIMQTGWMYDKGFWYYLQANGAMQSNCWAMYDGNWYFFNELGEMQTGWTLYGSYWYYMDEHGVMQKGWITYDKNKYYLNDDGTMRDGWLYNGKVWYYFGEGGKMKTGWQTINGKNYYFDSSGAMKTGMMFLDGRWINLNNV